MLSRNVGILDRDIRIVLGVLFGILSLFGPISFWQLIPAALALVMFATAALGACPLYRFFGINTVREPKSEDAHQLTFRK
jgi:hypothetical protein